MTDREWFSRAAAELGPLPRDYLVLDLETTGLSSADLPIQIGWALVFDGHACNVGAQTIDWSARHTDYFLDSRLQIVKQAIVDRDGTVYPFTAASLKADGRPYAEVLSAFLDLHAETVKGGLPLVCHNGLRTDVPILDRVASQYLGRRFTPGGYFDTMAIERALQTRQTPKAGENWDSFCRRTYYAGGSKVKSSLVGHCSHKYALAADLTRAHQADFDCRLTHLLVETYRGLCPEHLRGLL